MTEDVVIAVDQQQLLSTAQACGQQLAALINDILDLTRIQVRTDQIPVY